MSPTLTIRFAMLLGVLLFGAVVYVSRLSPNAPTVSAEQLRQLRWIGQGLWVVAIGGAAFALQRFHQSEAPTHRQTWSIIGWALGRWSPSLAPSPGSSGARRSGTSPASSSC